MLPVLTHESAAPTTDNQASAVHCLPQVSHLAPNCQGQQCTSRCTHRDGAHAWLVPWTAPCLPPTRGFEPDKACQTTWNELVTAGYQLIG